MQNSDLCSGCTVTLVTEGKKYKNANFSVGILFKEKFLISKLLRLYQAIPKYNFLLDFQKNHPKKKVLLLLPKVILNCVFLILLLQHNNYESDSDLRLPNLLDFVQKQCCYLDPKV